MTSVTSELRRNKASTARVSRRTRPTHWETVRVSRLGGAVGRESASELEGGQDAAAAEWPDTAPAPHGSLGGVVNPSRTHILRLPHTGH